ncbi:MAG: hypothetical protein M3R44_03195 [Candidatus Eremiobacteraeota bacterium]|nr:hypothetical protein [Candidatus Eremiobacteraeota bacterium]
MVLAFWFGHHHAAAATPLDRVLASLQAIPIPIWAAIIGFLAAAVTPLLNHYLTIARERAAVQRAERHRQRAP